MTKKEIFTSISYRKIILVDQIAQPNVFYNYNTIQNIHLQKNY